MLGQEEWISPHDAALLHRSGPYIDTAEVNGEDHNKLSRKHADFLVNQCGYKVDPADIDPNT